MKTTEHFKNGMADFGGPKKGMVAPKKGMAPRHSKMA
jgi:hypothetical protein